MLIIPSVWPVGGSDAVGGQQLRSAVLPGRGLRPDLCQFVLVHADHPGADCGPGGLYLCLRIDTFDAGRGQLGGSADRRNHLRRL